MHTPTDDLRVPDAAPAWTSELCEIEAALQQAATAVLRMAGELAARLETGPDRLPAEAEALAWHLQDASRALRTATHACDSSRCWSERLSLRLTEQS